MHPDELSLLPVTDTSPHPLCAVFFDLDGTLIDSLPDLVRAANALRREYRLDPLPGATIAGFIGDGVRHLAGCTIAGRRAFTFSDQTLDHLYRRFIVHYERHLTDATVCYPGVAETLDKLHERGIALALISNKSEALVNRLLAFFRLNPFFGVVFGGDSLERKKPHPMPLKQAASNLNIPIESALMVGDSRNDLLAGKAAGSRTCLVDFGYGDPARLRRDHATRPDLCIGRLSELLKLFP